jgi:type II secretory pathway component PulK
MRATAAALPRAQARHMIRTLQHKAQQVLSWRNIQSTRLKARRVFPTGAMHPSTASLRSQTRGKSEHPNHV